MASESRKIKTDVDLARFIGDNYKSSEAGWDDAPRYSRRTGKYSLSDFDLMDKSIEGHPGPVQPLEAVHRPGARAGGNDHRANDFYATEERYWGKTAARIDDFTAEVEKWIEEVAKDKLTLDDVALYAYAQHAPERNKWIAAQPPRNAGRRIRQTTTRAGVDRRRQERGARATQLQRHAAVLRAFIQGTRDSMFNEGLIDQDEYDTWTNMFQFCVPLRGLEGFEEKRHWHGLQHPRPRRQARHGPLQRARQIIRSRWCRTGPGLHPQRKERDRALVRAVS